MRLSARSAAPRATVVALALLLGTWSVAWAHTRLVSAEPAAGSRLAASPARIRLVFSEELEASLARVRLVTLAGDTVPLAAAGDPHDVHAVVAPLATPLPSGRYVVRWHVVSDDGHPVDGTLRFEVALAAGTEPAPVDPASVAPAPAPVAAPLDTADALPETWGPSVAGAPVGPSLLRGLAVGALMALAGLLGFLAWPGGAGEGDPAPAGARRLARLLSIVAPALVALYAAAWLANASPDHRLTSDWIVAGLGSGAGQVELWRLGLTLLVPWALLLARRRGLAALLASGALAVGGAAGHSAAIAPAWAVPAKALHLLAAAAWLGGLLWLLLGARDARDVRDSFAGQAARVSSIALAAVVVVVVTGVVQTRLFLPSFRDLVRSAYGAVTLAKVAGLLALAAFGAYHRSRVLPRLRSDRGVASAFARTLRGEVALFALVVLLGGLLAFVPPPEPPPPSTTVSTLHAP